MKLGTLDRIIYVPESNKSTRLSYLLVHKFYELLSSNDKKISV